MGDYNPGTGTATVAQNTGTITITGADVSTVLQGMNLYLGSRTIKGTGYKINTVTPNANPATGGTLVTFDPIPAAYNNQPFLIDTLSLSGSGTSLVVAQFAQIQSRLQTLLGIGTNYDGNSTTLTLNKATTAQFNRLVFSVGNVQAFRIEQMTVAGVESLVFRASTDGFVSAVNAITVDSAGNIGLKGISATAANTHFGLNALPGGTGSGNTAIGYLALNADTSGSNNTAVGDHALAGNLTGTSNTALGSAAMQVCTSGAGNTAVGVSALAGTTTGGANVAVGQGALQSNTTGGNNIAIGLLALNSSKTASFNNAIGVGALGANTTGTSNNVLGHSALSANTTGSNNVAIGEVAMLGNTTGSGNTGIGLSALQNNSSGNNNTGLGYSALSSYSAYSDTTGVGYNAQVTGSNQLQLGDSASTAYAYGALQNRSDERDKTDVRDTTLGLAFIKTLRPVDYRWDMREDYRPPMPTPIAADASEEDLAAHKTAMAVWMQASQLANLTHDGAHKRSRFHHGLIAQEVKSAADALGIDFAGYQDHALKGGDDVKSLGYEEFIAPLIKAIQELASAVDSVANDNAEIRARLATLEAKAA